MGHRIGLKYKEKLAQKPSLRDLFSHSSQACPLLLTLLALSSHQDAQGAVFQVTDPSDYSDRLKEAPQVGTLRDAIRRAEKTPGPHTIVIQTSQPIQLKSSLPPLSLAGLKIIGSGSLPAVIDGQNRYSFGSAPEQLSIENVTLRNFSTDGFNGGSGSGGGGGGAALGGFSYLAPGQGPYTFTNTTFIQNTVTGGNGGDGVANFTGKPAGDGKFVQGGGGGAGPAGHGGEGEKANALANSTTNGGYGGGGGGGGGKPGQFLATHGGAAKGFGGGSGGSDLLAGNSSPIPSPNPDFPPKNVRYMGGVGAPGSLSEGGSGGDFIAESSSYRVESGKNSLQGGAGGGAGHTLNKSIGSSDGGSTNVPEGIYLLGGGGGGGGGTLSPPAGNGGSGGVYSGGGGGGSSVKRHPSGHGGRGGFGGGGGGAGAHSTSPGGPAGFAGGSGQASVEHEGLSYGGGGGGGAGLGGVFYIDSGISPADAVSVIFKDCTFLHNRAEGGSGGANGVTQAEKGRGLGRDVFMTAGSTVAIEMERKDTTLDLDGEAGARSKGAIPLSAGGIKVSGLGRTLTLTNPDSQFSGVVTVEKGARLAVETDGNLGVLSNQIHLNGGTLCFPSLTTSRDILLSGLSELSGTEWVHRGTVQDGQTPGTLQLKTPGTYTLNPPSANTYSGGTEVGAGVVLRAEKGDRSLGGSTAPLSFVATDGVATVDFPNGVDSKRPIHVKGLAAIHLNDTSGTFSGPIMGEGVLKIDGTQILNIQAHPETTFSGNYFNEHLNVTLSGSDPLGKTSLLSLEKLDILHLEGAALSNKIILPQGPLQIDAISGKSTFSGQIEGDSPITYSSSGGTLALAPTVNNSTFTGPIEISKGSLLQAEGKNPLGTGPITSLGGSLEFVGDGEYNNRMIDFVEPTSFYAQAGTTTVFGPQTQLTGGDLNLFGPGEVQIKSAENSHRNTHLNSDLIVKIEGENPLSTGLLSIGNATLSIEGSGATLDNPIHLQPNGVATILTQATSKSYLKGPLTSDPSSSVHYAGTGTLHLLAPSTAFAGQFQIQSGVVETAGESPLGVGTAVLGGGSLKLNDSGHYQNDLVIQVPSTITARKGISTLSGQLKGPQVPLFLDGPGKVILTGDNVDYKGQIHLNRGLLQVAEGKHLGDATILLNGGHLALSGSSTFQNRLGISEGQLLIDGSNIWAGPIAGSLLHLKSEGKGTLVLTGDNSQFAEGFALHPNTCLSVASQQHVGPGPILLKGGHLTFTGQDLFKNRITLSAESTTFALEGKTNTLTGPLTGSGHITMEGTGELVLLNASTFSGPMTLSGGRLVVSGTNPLGKDTLTLDGGILKTTGDSFFQNKIILGPATQEVQVDRGFSAGFTGPISGEGQLLFNSPSATLILTNNSYCGGTHLLDGTLRTYGPSPFGTGPFHYEGGSLVFSRDGSYPNDFHLSKTATITLQTNTWSHLSGEVSGQGGLTYAGPGHVNVSSSNNSYEGGTTLSQGATVSIDSDRALGQAGTPLTFSDGSGKLVLASSVQFSNRPLQLEQDGFFHLNDGISTLTGPILGDGSLILTTEQGKNGKLSIQGSAEHLHTYLYGSTLELSGQGTLGRGSLVFSKDGAGNSSTLQLLSSATYHNPIELVDEGTIVSGPSTHNVFTGELNGPARLTLQGPGSFTLTADQTPFHGGITVQDSALHLSEGYQIGSGLLILSGNSTLQLLGSSTFPQPMVFHSMATLVASENTSNTFTGPLQGPGGFILTGTGTVTVKGSSTYQGGTVLQGATLQVEGANPLGTGALSLDGGHLEFLGNTSFSTPIHLHGNGVIQSDKRVEALLSGPIAGEGALTIETPGSVTLIGNNTHTGGMNLTKGLLKIGGEHPLGSGPLTFSGGNLQLLGHQQIDNQFSLLNSATLYTDKGTFSQLSGEVSGQGGLTYAGPGHVNVSSSNNSYEGGTTLSQGATVSIDSDRALGQAGTPLTFSAGSGKLVLASPVQFSNRPLQLEQDGFFHLNDGISTLTGPIVGDGSLILTTEQGKNGKLSIQGSAEHLHTYLYGSTLELSGQGTLGRGSLVFSKDGARNSSTLQLLSSATYHNPIELVDEGTIVSGPSTHNVFTGELNGPARLTLQGPGSFTLTADQTPFHGGITVQDSALHLSEGHQIGCGLLILSGNSTLQLLGSSTFPQPMVFHSMATLVASENTSNTFTGPLQGPGGFILTGTGTVTVKGSSTYQGGTVLQGATLQVEGTNPLGTGALSLDGGHLEFLGNTSFSGPVHVGANGMIQSKEKTDILFSGPLSGVGGLTIQTLGSVTLTGNNTHTGGINLAKGLLKIGGQNPLGSGALCFNGGNLHLIEDSHTSNEIFFLRAASIKAEGGTLSRMDGPLTGSGQFTKTGRGALHLTSHNTLSGPTSLNQGQLIIDGSHLHSPITSLPQTVLSGTGHVGYIDLFGILKPGHPSGTLHVDEIVFEAGSVFRPRCLHGETAQLAAEHISIDPNALLDPIIDPFIPRSYIVATGLINPEERFTLGYSGTPLFPIDVAYRPDSIMLSVTQIPLQKVLPTGNLQQIGACFEQLPPSADLLSLQAVINLLPLDLIPSAFAQFDPSFYNAVAYVEEAATYRTRAIYTAHAQNRRFEGDSLWAVWGTGFGESIHQHSLGREKSQSGYDDHLAGFVTGLDGWALDHLLLSGGFSYGHSAVNWNQADASSSVKSYTAFVGSTWFGQLFSVDGYMSYSYHRAEGARKIYVSPTNLITPPVNSPIPFDLFGLPIDRKLEQNSEANSGTFHVGGLYSYPWLGGLSFLSFVNFDYFVVSQNSFDEKGGGVLNMGLHSKTSDLFRPEIGLGVSFLGSTYLEMNLFANFTLSYVKEVRFSGRGTTTSFAGNGCQFKLYGLYPQQNLVSTSIEVGAASYEGFGLSLNYTGIFGSHFVDNGGQLEITYLF